MAQPTPHSAYKPPSDLKPALFLIFLSSLWPFILTFNIVTSPHGIYDLHISRTIIFSLLWLAQVRYQTFHFFTCPLRHLPRPASEHPIYGEMSLFMHPTPYKGIAKWFREIPNEGLIYIRGLFHMSDHLLITSPAALYEVLNSRCYDYAKSPDTRKILSFIIGDGMVTAEGKVHKAQRKAVAPAFQGKHIRELTPLFWNKALQMVEGIVKGTSASILPDETGNADEKNDSNSKIVEISTLASRATLDIIGKAGFGRDFNTVENDGDELAKLYDFLFDPNRGFNLTYVLINTNFPDWFVDILPWKRNRLVQAASMNLRAICRKLIAEKKQILQEEKLEAGVKSGAEVDILSALLRDNQIDDDGLVDQMLTFLAAGHETTANATSWACYLLSRHPSTQAQLRQELQSSGLAAILHPSTSLNTLKALPDALDSLPLLQATINEALRLYPPAPAFVRSTTTPTIIQGHFIPAGVDISLCPWATNRDPELWGPDSDEFKPERWLSEDTTKRVNSYEFLTFLHGPRSCIGQAFARAELKCLVASLVLTFKMELINKEEAEATGSVTIKVKDGLKLRLTKLADDTE